MRDFNVSRGSQEFNILGGQASAEPAPKDDVFKANSVAEKALKPAKQDNSSSPKATFEKEVEILKSQEKEEEIVPREFEVETKQIREEVKETTRESPETRVEKETESLGLKEILKPKEKPEVRSIRELKKEKFRKKGSLRAVAGKVRGSVIELFQIRQKRENA